MGVPLKQGTQKLVGVLLAGDTRIPAMQPCKSANIAKPDAKSMATAKGEAYE